MGDDISPVLKLSRFKKSKIVEKHLEEKVRLLPLFILDKNIIYHGTDHKINTKSLGPKVVTIHDMQPFVGKWLDDKFAKTRREVIHKTLTSSLDKVIAVSHFTKNEIIRFYPQLASKIEVVYHGHNFDLNLSKPNQKLEISPDNKLEKLIKGRPFLFFIGNIEERKNLENQIDAFVVLKEKMPDLIFILAGNLGFNGQKIVNHAKKSKFHDSIYFTGYLTEREKKFALENTSCLMFASWYEGFGIPVIEALALNSKVLISKTPALMEIAGVECHSAHPENISEIIETTWQIIENGNKQNINLETWKNKWSWANAATQTYAIYQGL